MKNKEIGVGSRVFCYVNGRTGVVIAKNGSRGQFCTVRFKDLAKSEQYFTYELRLVSSYRANEIERIKDGSDTYRLVIHNSDTAFTRYMNISLEDLNAIQALLDASEPEA